jgi:hypothetical protein
MRYSTLIFPFAFLVATTQAQTVSTFQLKDYKYRYQRYQGLNINGSFKENASKSQYNNGNAFGGINGTVNYFRVNSSDKYQRSLYIDGNIDFAYEPQNLNGTLSRSVKALKLNPAIRITSNNRKFGKGLRFTEVNGQLTFNNNSINTVKMVTAASGEQFSNYQEQDLISSAHLSIGVGRGRLEYVTDAAQAMFMLQDLQKKGCLTREPNENDILVLSRTLTQMRNFRFFDSRMKMIRQLERIDSSLQSLGLIHKVDVKYFSTINDNWFFARTDIRYSGQQWAARIYANYSNNYSGRSFNTRQTNLTLPSDSIYNNFFSTPATGLQLQYIRAKPTSLNWQNYCEFNIWGGAGMNMIHNTLRGYNQEVFKELNVSLSGSRMYIPSTRTLWEAGYTLMAQSRQNGNLKIVPRFDAGVYANIRHWLSPRLQATARFTVSNTSFANTNNVNAYNIKQALSGGFVYYMY